MCSKVLVLREEDLSSWAEHTKPFSINLLKSALGIFAFFFSEEKNGEGAPHLRFVLYINFLLCSGPGRIFLTT